MVVRPVFRCGGVRPALVTRTTRGRWHHGSGRFFHPEPGGGEGTPRGGHILDTP